MFSKTCQSSKPKSSKKCHVLFEWQPKENIIKTNLVKWTLWIVRIVVRMKIQTVDLGSDLSGFDDNSIAGTFFVTVRFGRLKTATCWKNYFTKVDLQLKEFLYLTISNGNHGKLRGQETTNCLQVQVNLGRYKKYQFICCYFGRPIQKCFSEESVNLNFFQHFI